MRIGVGRFELNGQPPDVAAAIRHLKHPEFPTLHFEWHPVKGKVYVIQLQEGQATQQAEVLADEVHDHGTAHMAVLVWLRGYREGQRHGPGAA